MRASDTSILIGRVSARFSAGAELHVTAIDRVTIFRTTLKDRCGMRRSREMI